MDLKDEEKAINELVQALSLCDDVELIKKFLPCLLTENELHEVSSRWALVRMIDQGVSQRKISSELGLSLCKITRGSKELKKDSSPFKQMISLIE
ncbi:MAG: Trp family transcriptional regulator [Spirochaetaceae bacterium]|jgi:TrpR family trp operon transcriptional repressor|nr:Trp family transcriptional regulator [Spirochaetaceae bacterium]